MSNRKHDDSRLLTRISEALQHSPEHLNSWLNLVERYLSAASDMTKDEIALIEAYLKYDLKALGNLNNEVEENTDIEKEAFQQVVTNLMWQQLNEITDKTQIEWHEVLEDLRHQGVYHAGDPVALGIIICKKCGYKFEQHHESKLQPCIKCHGTVFARQAFPV